MSPASSDSNSTKTRKTPTGRLRWNGGTLEQEFLIDNVVRETLPDGKKKVSLEGAHTVWEEVPDAIED